MMKRFFLFLLTISLYAAVFAQTTSEPTYVFNQDFADGEELFQLNKPAEAIAHFEKIIDDKNVHPAVFIYLGVAYYQVEEYQKSLNVCVKGLTRADTDHKILAYNAGNSAYALGNYARADACYAIAIKEDSNFSAAYLNRANAQLKQDHLEDARENYKAFIAMESENEQRPAIEQLIALLDEEILRRENEKPELIAPEALHVGNEEMQIPADVEKVLLDDMPIAEAAQDGEVIEELVSGEDFIAPALPPEELTIEPSRQERVVVDSELEVPAAATTAKGAEPKIEETVVHEAERDLLEADEAARRARWTEEPIEEEIEIPVLPDANPRPPEEPRNYERVTADDIPATEAK